MNALRTSLLALALPAAIVLAACQPAPAAPPASVPTPEPAPTPAPTPQPDPEPVVPAPPTTAPPAPALWAPAGPRPNAVNGDQYDIEFVFDPSVLPSMQAATSAAALQWSYLINAGLPSVTLPANSTCWSDPIQSGPVDDLRVIVTARPIDGPSGVLAEAGPCQVRHNGLPAVGRVDIDTADLPWLDAHPITATQVMQHELGHVLGIGTMWNSTAVPGAAVADAWTRLGGPGVPHNDGTGHWVESEWDNELMTPVLDEWNPLSALTAAALTDLGYSTDTQFVSPYSRPSAAVRTAATDEHTEQHEHRHRDLARRFAGNG